MNRENFSKALAKRMNISETELRDCMRKFRIDIDDLINCKPAGNETLELYKKRMEDASYDANTINTFIATIMELNGFDLPQTPSPETEEMSIPDLVVWMNKTRSKLDSATEKEKEMLQEAINNLNQELNPSKDESRTMKKPTTNIPIVELTSLTNNTEDILTLYGYKDRLAGHGCDFKIVEGFLETMKNILGFDLPQTSSPPETRKMSVSDFLDMMDENNSATDKEKERLAKIVNNYYQKLNPSKDEPRTMKKPEVTMLLTKEEQKKQGTSSYILSDQFKPS